MDEQTISQVPIRRGSELYQKYKESTKIRASNYYHAHKEACLKANREYQLANREKLSSKQRERRQKKKIEATATAVV